MSGESFERFHALHHAQAPFLLANAWDAASARLMQDAGFQAIGTTSAGLAVSLGWPDNECLPVEELLAAAGRINRVLSVPFSVDIEAGYFDDETRFKEFIRALLDLGIAGLNMQDAVGLTGELRDIRSTALQIEWLRDVMASQNQRVFINARTDAFWLSGNRSAEARLQEALERARVFKAVGADGMFVPGLSDITSLRAIADACALPVNILAKPDLPDFGSLFSAGVRRVSLGSGLFRNLYGKIIERGTRMLKDVEFSWLGKNTWQYAELDSLFCDASK